jgi:hypothetical protein
VARIQKKRLDTPVDEAGWNIGLGDLKLGNLLGGLNLHTDAQGNRKLGGNLRAKPFGKHGPSMSIGTDDLGQWSKKKKNVQKRKPVQKQQTKRRGTQQLQKSNRQLQGYNTSLKPGDPGYKSPLRRRQEAKLRNQ